MRFAFVLLAKLTKKLLLLAFLLLPASLLAQSVAVSGNVRTLITTPSATQTFVRFKLQNFGATVPRLTGTGVIVQLQYDAVPSSTGDISLTVYGNDFIAPSGTFYRVEFWYQGHLQIASNYSITGSTFNLNTATPISTVPVPFSALFGIKSYVHTQASSAATWTIPHGFGDRNVVVQCTDPANRVLYPDSVDLTDNNTVTVTFVGAQTGSCIAISGGNTVLTTAIGDALIKNSPSPQTTNSQPLNLGGDLSVVGNAAFKSGVPWIDVLAYGAVGNDSTDDTAAIQAAIDAASTAGACVRFNGKTYKTTAVLTLGTAPCLAGDGSQRTIIHNIVTACFTKKATTTTVYDAHIQGIGCRDNNTGSSTTVGFDFTEFNRSYLDDLDVWYKQIGYQWKRNAGGGGNFYNKGFHLKANDTKTCMSFDTAFAINQNDFYATECRRLAGTWDAGGGEVGINLSGNGNHFYGTYVSASGATSTGLKFTTPASQNAFYGLYVESLPTIDVDATGVASPNYVDGVLSDGRTAPLITDPNANLYYRTDNATATVGGVTGQPALRWPRSVNANGSGTGIGIGYTALYPPGATADPTSPTPLAGAFAYRSDLSRLRYFDTTWHSIPGLDTTDTLTNKTLSNAIADTISSTAGLALAPAASAQGLGLISLTAANGGATFPNGAAVGIAAGDAYASGNNNGGNISLTPGLPNGTGTQGKIILNRSVSGDGSGLKHGRVTTGSCGTTGCSVTLSWTTAFADGNYTVFCSVEDATAQSETTGLRLARVTSKIAASVTVAIDNDSGAGVTGTLDCVGVHD